MGEGSGQRIRGGAGEVMLEGRGGDGGAGGVTEVVGMGVID